MSDDTPGGGDELDVLRLYVWGMGFLTVALGIVLYVMIGKADNVENRVKNGRAKLERIATAKSEIQGMLNVYKTNREDEARTKALTWFAAVWRSKGINDASIKYNEWDESPRRDASGFLEENISFGFNARAPLTREKVAAFCHAVERKSSRLRVLELKLNRAGKKDQELAGDEWYGKVMIGYRIPDVSQ